MTENEDKIVLTLGEEKVEEAVEETVETEKDLASVPVSDIVALFEKLDGIDSVKVWFDADVENEIIYS